jgi:hypothetical protein
LVLLDLKILTENPKLGSIHLKVRFLVLSSLAAAFSIAQSPSSPPDVIVENYRAATERQQRVMKGASMEVEIAGAIPKLKKQGRLHALRHITALGRITYEALRFQGDDTVKKQVIAKYLQAEQETQEDPTIAVTPDNYKFKFKGRNQIDGRDVYVFQVTPRKKRDKLYKGEICLDAATYLRVQESGYLVKSPSLVIRKVHFVRKYDIRDGLSVPRQVQSEMDTWLVGRVELTIDYSNFSMDAAAAAAVEANDQ